MQLSPRYTTNEDGETSLHGVIFVVESPRESDLLDQLFGDKVIDSDGLIYAGDNKIECRLSDGYADHYFFIKATA